jgi:hypothetical protein
LLRATPSMLLHTRALPLALLQSVLHEQAHTTYSPRRTVDLEAMPGRLWQVMCWMV